VADGKNRKVLEENVGSTILRSWSGIVVSGGGMGYLFDNKEKKREILC